MDASQEIIQRKHFWNYYSKVSKIEHDNKLSRGVNFSHAKNSIINAFREISQRIYYSKFYLKVFEIGNNIKLSKGGSFIHAENMKFGNNIFISNNFQNNIPTFNSKVFGPLRDPIFPSFGPQTP